MNARVYCPPCSKSLNGGCTYIGPGGGNYLGRGVPTLARSRVNNLDGGTYLGRGGHLPLPGGSLPLPGNLPPPPRCGQTNILKLLPFPILWMPCTENRITQKLKASLHICCWCTYIFVLFSVKVALSLLIFKWNS